MLVMEINYLSLDCRDEKLNQIQHNAAIFLQFEEFQLLVRLEVGFDIMARISDSDLDHRRIQGAY